MVRCQPWLGTFVEIRARGRDDADPSERMAAAVAEAFDRVRRVDELMSAFRPDSDVARLNREARFREVRVHPWTFEVLRLSLEISRRSAGAFDVTASSARLGQRSGSFRSLRLLTGNRARFMAGVQVDLGGVAKGFAVDLAVEALLGAGAESGSVNAGGDLRVFGDAVVPVAVRHPADPSRIVRVLPLRNAAIATSAVYADPHAAPRLASRQGIRHRGEAALSRGRSISVVAPRCAVADALTKAIAILPESRALSLLERYSANALDLSVALPCESAA